MILIKRVYRNIDKLYKSQWHKLDAGKVRLTEDLQLQYLVLEVRQRLR